MVRLRQTRGVARIRGRYGGQVHYNTFDSNNTLAARMLAGHSGYDVVFPSGAYLESMTAAGVFRVIIASNGDAMQAPERVKIAADGKDIRYSIPREGAVMWFDVMAIPIDAAHPDNAHLFINFLIDPAVAADNSNAIRFPNGNEQSLRLAGAAAQKRRRFPHRRTGFAADERPKSEEYVRLRTRMWARFRTGR